MSDLVHPTSAFQLPAVGNADDLWRKLGELYGSTLQRSWQEWFSTSAQIVQEHVVRAMLETSQALVTNAAQLQQKTWTQLMDTNQHAAALVADGMARAATDAVNQAGEAAGQAVEQAGKQMHVKAGRQAE